MDLDSLKDERKENKPLHYATNTDITKVVVVYGGSQCHNCICLVGGIMLQMRWKKWKAVYTYSRGRRIL